MTKSDENSADGIGRRSLRVQGMPPPHSDMAMMTNPRSLASNNTGVQNPPPHPIGMPIAPIPPISPFPPREIQVLAPPEFTRQYKTHAMTPCQATQSTPGHTKVHPVLNSDNMEIWMAIAPGLPQPGSEQTMPHLQQTGHFQICPTDNMTTTCHQVRSTN